MSPAAAATKALPPAVARFKGMIVASGVAGIIVGGTLIGATLKEEKQSHDDRRKLADATLDEQLYIQESRRAHLIRAKADLEAKLAAVNARIEAAASGGDSKKSTPWLPSSDGRHDSRGGRGLKE